MAAFIMYGTPEDWEDILEILFSHRELCLIPDTFYPTRKADCFRHDTAAFRKALSHRRGLFIKGPFTTGPIGLSEIRAHGFSVDDTIQGPLLSVFLPVPALSSEGLILLRPGDLSYQSRFWSQDDRTVFSPSAPLKEAFYRLKREFAKSFLKIKLGGTVFVGKEAFDFLSKGSSRILSKSQWWSVQGGIPRLDRRLPAEAFTG